MTNGYQRQETQKKETKNRLDASLSIQQSRNVENVEPHIL